jgi:sirohydrochlorin cobaltochelatase
MMKDRKLHKTRKNETPENIAVVLAMHGMPPKDFPRTDLQEFFMLHTSLGSTPSSLSNEERQRYTRLHDKMRNWPRHPDNDPFNAAATELALLLKKELSCPVYVGYNEFCAPNLDEAIAFAVAADAAHIIVATPMMTRGGEHAEIDISAAIDRARARFPNVRFTYCWPFDSNDVAHFLAGQIHHFLTPKSAHGSDPET